MSEAQPPQPFSEADEQLFQKTRNELLGIPSETPPVAPAEQPAPTPAPGTDGQWLWQLIVLLVLIVAWSGVTFAHWHGWLDAETFATLKLVCLSISLFCGVLVLAGRARKQKAAKYQPVPLIAAPPAPFSWRRLVLSFLWFLLIGALLFTPVELAWLVGVLLLHESGHYLGMRYFGYRDLQMFFIPGFGAAVRGEKAGVPAWQEAIVLLLGPLPGLFLGCGIYFLDLATPQPILRTGATWLVTINFLNLLPFEPLDGGRFCNRLLFSRFRWLEFVAVVLAAVGLVFVCLGPGLICLGLSGAFALFVLAPARYKTASAALELQSRWPDLPLKLTDLSEAQWRDLFNTSRARFRSDKFLTVNMKAIYARALLRPDSGSAALALFAVYLGAIALTLVTASVTRLGGDAGNLPIRLQNEVSQSVQLGPLIQQRYLALGDSYTIGEGVSPSERWPVHLVSLVREKGIEVSDPTIIAKTGWTTAPLYGAIERAKPEGPFDLVSLLIGVNNQFQGRAIEEFRTEFAALLDRAVSLAGDKPERVLVLSIPDWGVTPFARGKDRARIAMEIDRFNAVVREVSQAKGAHHLDITPASRQARDDPNLIASDGLHPSGKMYARWAELALPAAIKALGERRP